MVGDGPDRSIAEQYCRDHGFCHAVSFLGTIFAVEEVLIGSDLFLFTSESESFGLAILEAMACGVPVVASGAGGVPEVVADGETGFLHPVGDVEAMAASAVRVLTEPGLGQRLGTAARRRAVGRFGQDEQVNRYRRIYRRVVERANGKTAAPAAAVDAGAG
jgi:glycosyltransferase involved in cell wall biosynthesis